MTDIDREALLEEARAIGEVEAAEIEQWDGPDAMKLSVTVRYPDDHEHTHATNAPLSEFERAHDLRIWYVKAFGDSLNITYVSEAAWGVIVE